MAISFGHMWLLNWFLTSGFSVAFLECVQHRWIANQHARLQPGLQMIRKSFKCAVHVAFDSVRPIIIHIFFTFFYYVNDEISSHAFIDCVWSQSDRQIEKCFDQWKYCWAAITSDCATVDTNPCLFAIRMRFAPHYSYAKIPTYFPSWCQCLVQCEIWMKTNSGAACTRMHAVQFAVKRNRNFMRSISK